jgi:hypothetical protein
MVYATKIREIHTEYLLGNPKAREHIGDKVKRVSVLELQSSGARQTGMALSCEPRLTIIF